MRRLIPLLSAVMLSPTAAFALSYTTPLPVPFSIPGSISVGVQGFNPALGTLTNAFLDGQIEFAGEATFTNPTPDPLNVIETVRLVSLFSGRPGYDFNVHLDVFFDLNSGLIAPGESVVVSFTGSSSNPFPGFLGPLPGLITAGLVPIDFFTGQFELVSGQFLTDISAQVTSGQVSMFYEFEAAQIPEPSLWVMLGAGLVSLATAARRQRRPGGN